MTPWMQTRGGVAVDLLEPDLTDVTIGEVAYALAHTYRWCGHWPMLVAQHSVLVARAVLLETDDEHAALDGLMHDAKEAFIGDQTSPVKRALKALGGGPAYEELYGRMGAACASRWGFRDPPPPAVVRHDLNSLATERRDLGGGLEARCWGVTLPDGSPLQPWPAQIVPWEPERAERRFLAAFHELGGRP